MRLKASPHYVIVKCSKLEQSKLKEKIGSIIIPPDEHYMAYNLEYGEVYDIGVHALAEFPELRVGNDIIIHHSVQGMDRSDSEKSHLIYEDDEYMYYATTTFEVVGDGVSKRTEIYATVINGEIVPHKDFIFLKVEQDEVKSFSSQDEQIDQRLNKTKGGLFVFSEWKESAEQMTSRMEKIKHENLELSKTTNQNKIKTKLAQNDEEMEKISMELNKITFLPFTVEYAPEILNRWFGRNIKKGDTMFMQNNACKTIVNYKGNKFIVAQTKYIGFLKK